MFDLNSLDYAHARRAVQMFDKHFLRDPNCTGVGVGTKSRGGHDTDEIALVIFVARKIPRSAVPEWALLPSFVDVGGGRLVPVDVVQAGPFYPHANTAKSRPAQPGTSISNVNIAGLTGTFGAIVIDDKSGKEAILSNNHILADCNQASIGSEILQPGRADQGAPPADVIATLTRFVKIIPESEGTNVADVAIATPVKATDIINPPLNSVPAPSEKHPGVGLLVGGDGATRSNWSPLSAALNAIGASLPVKGALLEAYKDLELQKTGRTTERTTGIVKEINVTIRFQYPGIGAALLANQFTTTFMSEVGDSGSIAVTLNPVK